MAGEAWLYSKDSSHVVGIRDLRNSLTPGYLNNATVTLTLMDAITGVAVAGGDTWPITLAYVAGSNGMYRATLSYAITVTTGQRLLASYLVVSGTVRRTWVVPVQVVRSVP